MNVDIVKDKIGTFINQKIKIKVYLGRNKYEYIEGFIEKMHSNVFTVRTNKGIKTFSYSDVLIKNVIISNFN